MHVLVGRFESVFETRTATLGRNCCTQSKKCFPPVVVLYGTFVVEVRWQNSKCSVVPKQVCVTLVL